MSFLAVSTSIGISTNKDKKVYQAQRMHKSPNNRMRAYHYAISKLGATVRQKSNAGDPHAVQSLGCGRLLGYLVVQVDVDSRRQARGKIRQVHQVYKRHEGNKDGNSAWFVQRIEKTHSTLKADSEDFCSKGIATLCVSPVALDRRCFVSFALFLTDAARRLFTAVTFFPIAR